LPNTVFNLVKVANGVAGKSPTLTFGVQDKTGKTVAVPKMDRLALVLAGPTTDYSGYVSEDPRKTAVANNDGTYNYTFKAAIPASATGTFSIGIEGYSNQTLLPGTKKAVVVRDAGANKVISFSVDGSTLAPRRTVVAIDNCNQCHSSLSVHGDNRNQIVMCVLCHNPNTTDADQRTAANQPPQTVDFRTMIHKIHRGENLDAKDQFTVIGFGKSVNNFNDIRFPGDLRNCEKCHVNASEQLPLGDNLLSVVTPRGYMNPTTPTAAACLACHDTKPAAAHAMGNANSLGEACAVCHSASGEFAIDKVHAR
jgi:OmcA/MtrC family decaheme c-type cytochrome